MLLRCSHHVEEQFGELVQFLVAEPVFVRKPADEIRLIQQRVDVDVQFLGQLRLGRRLGVQDTVGIPHIQGGKLYVEAVLFMR